MAIPPCTFCGLKGTRKKLRFGYYSISVNGVRRVFCGLCWMTYFHRYRFPY